MEIKQSLGYKLGNFFTEKNKVKTFFKIYQVVRYIFIIP